MKSEQKYIVRYQFHKQDYYSYKMFDQLKNATDFILELTAQQLSGKLYLAQEMEIEYKLEVKGVKETIEEKTVTQLLREL